MEKQNLILKHCTNLLKTEEVKKELKEIFKPLFDYFFKEISIYLFFFVFFILTSFLLHLGVLILLIRYNQKLKYS
jgi:hypothetical protein